MLERGTTFNGLRILGELGTGSMGKVYLAKQVSMDRLVALKVLDPKRAAASPTFGEMFVNEARGAASLNHPNIIAVHDAGTVIADGRRIHYFTMEYIDGESLLDRIERDGPMADEDLRWIARGVVDALTYAASKQIVHRDIKPANIMITPDRQVKLADFGLILAGEDGFAGKVVGTPRYMAPEQVRGRPVDHTSDQYSFGCTLFHMLTGDAPFDAPNRREIMRLQKHGEIPDPRDEVDCTDDWAELCMQLMAKEAEDRFPAFAELTDTVTRIATADASHGAPKRRRPRRRQHRAGRDTHGRRKPGNARSTSRNDKPRRPAKASADAADERKRTVDEGKPKRRLTRKHSQAEVEARRTKNSQAEVEARRTKNSQAEVEARPTKNSQAEVEARRTKRSDKPKADRPTRTQERSPAPTQERSPAPSEERSPTRVQTPAPSARPKRTPTPMPATAADESQIGSTVWGTEVSGMNSATEQPNRLWQGSKRICLASWDWSLHYGTIVAKATWVALCWLVARFIAMLPVIRAFAYRLVTPISRLVFLVTGLTWRVRIVSGQQHLLSADDEGTPLTAALLDGRHLPFIWWRALHEDWSPWRALIDKEWYRRWFRHLWDRYHVHYAKDASRQTSLLRLLDSAERELEPVSLSVDCQRRGHLDHLVTEVIGAAGATLIPVACSARPAWLFRQSPNHQLIPPPFATIHLAVGEPITFDPADPETSGQSLIDELVELQGYLDHLAHLRDPDGLRELDPEPPAEISDVLKVPDDLRQPTVEATATDEAATGPQDDAPPAAAEPPDAQGQDPAVDRSDQQQDGKG